MTPSNYPNKNTTPFVTTSEGIIWQGPDLPCINVCKGDTIGDITYKVALEVCDLKDQLDLSDFDLSCLFTACISCPDPVKTLKNILVLLRNKVCSLQEQIDACCDSQGAVDFPLLAVNLKCLAVTNGNGDVLNDDTNEEIIQAIIDRVCIHDTKITILESTVIDLQNQIDAIDINPTVTLPTVTSDCLFGGSRPLDQAHNLLDADHCQLKEDIGNISEVLAQQCDNLSTVIGLDPDFKASPSSLSDSLVNLWLLACNMQNRLQTIEENCCAITCDDVMIDFTINSISATEIQIAWNPLGPSRANNQFIPNGFTDCGSTLKITDSLGHTIMSTGLNIGNNSLSPIIDISGLTTTSPTGEVIVTTNGPLTFEVTAKICGPGLTCVQCLTKTITLNGGCPVCELCVDGTSGSVTIIYETL